MWKRLIPIVAAVVLIGGLLAYSQMRTEPAKVSGVVEADEIRLGSRIGGRVAEVLVDEGDEVSAGQPLVRLEPFDLQQRRSEAAALLGQREAEWAKLKAGLRKQEVGQAEARARAIELRLKVLEDGPRPQEVEAARARQRLAEAQLTRANEDYNRDRRLSMMGSGAVTQETLDRRLEELKVAQANLDVREQELELLSEGTRHEEIEQARAELDEAKLAAEQAKEGYREEDIQQAKAAVEAAEAGLAIIDQQLRELTVVAPVDGRIEAVELQPGDLVAAGAPTLSMLNTKQPWIRAYVPENRLDIEANSKVRVTIDSFPNQEFSGRVVFVARQAEFTPSNVQTPEERSKQVVRIKVAIEDPPKDLRPGMSGDIWLK
jgi:HlyD family secretion protein